ncbi:MAG: LacI family DNA-binding transcriptional regulator [Candidatus Accumulibacter sp.]|jgi:LacI family transcriptional regulator|nr:LacI family DNA-binding transcriptional regulator [Accumulibacter sp.]
MVNSKRVCLKDVARRANVSTGTVSMVLNNNPSVAQATREYVQRIIEELGYIYNRSAGQLRNKRTGIVGVSICNLANPYFAENTIGVETALRGIGLSLILGNSEESVEKQKRFLDTTRQHNVEGLILIPAIGTTRKMIEEITGWGIPLVMVSRYVRSDRADYAGCDNILAARLATNHLIEQGHERIAFVGAIPKSPTSRDRLRGFQSAMKIAGLDIPPKFVCSCEASRESGFHAIKSLLGSKKPPTGIVCFNDLLAFGVMLGLRSHGLEPGKDCSVVGIDNVPEAELWQPGLTTIAIDSRRIGYDAGRLLRKRMENPASRAETLLLTPKLVIRGSSGGAASV